MFCLFTYNYAVSMYRECAVNLYVISGALIIQIIFGDINKLES